MTATSPDATDDSAAQTDLAAHGITRTTLYQYQVGGFRYGNVNDAMAEARRRRATGPGA
jgi:hypothetical protein